NITNSIYWSNQGPQIEYDNYIPTITYSDIQGGWQGVGNIDVDPCFVDAINDDYHILYISLCRNTGNNNAASISLIDFENDPRISFGIVDIGADEFYPHFYCMGDFTPSGTIKAKCVGLPGSPINGLVIGLNAYDTPIPQPQAGDGAMLVRGKIAFA
ncbi:MAG: hypothetical protein P8Z74_02850, partial [Acidobacteriota bacterium]